MNLAVLAGHLAFGLIAFSFLVKDILWLRLVSILASSISVFYNWVIPAEPMWLAINWNFVFISLNLYHIAILIYEKRPIKMAPKDKELYETLFRDLSPVEYLKVTKIAEWKKFKVGDTVRVKDLPDIFYNRCQVYTRGALATVVELVYESPAPEDEAWDNCDNVEWFYSLVFRQKDLWADYPDAFASDTLETELPERWLESA